MAELLKHCQGKALSQRRDYEYGKGLAIVTALAASVGAHPSRARLQATPEAVKAVWFTLPPPQPWLGTSIRPNSLRARQQLLLALRSRGLPGKRVSDAPGTTTIHLDRLRFPDRLSANGSEIKGVDALAHEATSAYRHIVKKRELAATSSPANRAPLRSTALICTTPLPNRHLPSGTGRRVGALPSAAVWPWFTPRRGRE